jgi:LuxR family maltose regulon positive regulatory protein
MAAQTDMQVAERLLVQTKLHPPVRRDHVPRPGLVEQLLAPRRVALIRGPAGWGKTTLLAEWKESDARPFAWLSLDPDDNDRIRFWIAVVEALLLVDPRLGSRSIPMLDAPGVDVRSEVLPALVNELLALERPTVLVLDDYHVVESAEIHGDLAYLVGHLPASVELAVATRVEPRLPIARLRARGELVEVDAAALGFSEEETDALVNGVHRLGLGGSEIAALWRRTEGWAAGLYLATLSLRGRERPEAFIERFAGDDRHVVDYLAGEVLAGEDERVRRFLRRTSLLERLSAPLCAAVVGCDDASAMLAEIERSNLFLIPLDTTRDWYRYHHLFGELLRLELRRGEPALEPELHRRAAAWYLDMGLVSDAIHHTIAAGDACAAGELIASHWAPTLLRSGGDGMIDGWLRALPDRVVRDDARLCVARCYAGLGLGRMDQVEEWLAAAAAAPALGPFLDGHTSKEGALATTRAAFLIESGDVGRAEAAAREAMDAEPWPSPWCGIGVATLGLVHAARGEWAEARARMEEYARIGRDQGQFLTEVSGRSFAAACAAEVGDPSASSLAREATELAVRRGLSEHWISMGGHLALGVTQHDAGDLDAAAVSLARAAELGRRGLGPLVAWPLARLARLHASRDDRDAARRSTAEARELLARAPDPGALPRLLHEAAPRLAPPPAGVAPAAAAEPLSERELEVLRLLGTQLSQREIGAHLYVSLNTVKSHTKSIFRKLGVTGRADAVARARELGVG